jgi:CHASE2 domain-containing sensor protein
VKSLKSKIRSQKWLIGVIPAFTVMSLIILARLCGFLQGWEWITLDGLLRLRPSEPIDERITIIGINEQDIRSLQQYPIPDQEIASLIEMLKPYQPRGIGLDIVRDLPVQPGHDQLVQVFKTTSNLIGIQQVLGNTILPPPALPPSQIGFSDVIPDPDGRIRRSLLGTFTSHHSTYQFSFTIRLAEAYLKAEGITLENGQKDEQTMGFGEVEFPRFRANTGGYVNSQAGGVQTLVNYRNGQQNFRIISLADLKQGKFAEKWLQDRLILIGIMTTSAPDIVQTTAVFPSRIQGEIYGVEFQGHAISQILSAVLDQRPLLKSLSEKWEYLWIIAWGILGGYLSRFMLSPLKNLLSVLIASVSLIGISYIALLWGWWLPLIPALLALICNGIILMGFYLSHRVLLLQLTERQQTIEETFTLIHNGPLQTLAATLRKARDTHDDILITQLENLNLEIREIGNYLNKESLNSSETLHLGSGLVLDLNRPLYDLFYEVYSSTLNRSLPYLETLRIKTRSFDPLVVDLSLEEKRSLCLFLEEALCNIGKHAQGVTHVSAVGKEQEGWYYLTIQDNGNKSMIKSERSGTKQGKKLAKKLKGNFRRENLKSKGVLCELAWPLSQKKFLKLPQWINIKQWKKLEKFNINLH